MIIYKTCFYIAYTDNHMISISFIKYSFQGQQLPVSLVTVRLVTVGWRLGTKSTPIIQARDGLKYHKKLP
jgi:hypothetical protein